MSVTRLVDLFSKFSTSPIQVSEVRDQIVEWGFYDNIVIAPFDGPIGSLRGNIIVYENLRPYGDVKALCVVRYNGNSPLNWQRLICVKELIHSLDPDHLKIDSRAKAEELLTQFSLDGHLDMDMSLATIFEEIATYQAIAILCPDEVVERFIAEGANAASVAMQLDIPERYASMILDPGWAVQKARILLLSE